ncbi:MAG TPA: glycosyltransferase family 4 protein [Candidatus Saccharimonadales bacterium]|nr:glycosyltransferase family 4 protein [Candidatus Saccharimonadales bacterium]
MKIGLVCPYNISYGGGVQQLVLAYQAELRRRGHDAIVITPEPRTSTEDFERDHIIYLGNGTEFSNPLHTTGQVSVGLNDEIDHVLKEYKFDVLHFHEPGVPMLSRQMLVRSNTVNVATFHAAFPETLVGRTFARVASPYIKPLLQHIHEYVAVSEAAAEYVHTLTKEPVAIIPNAIDLKHFTNPGQRDDSESHKTIFYVGRLENRKGVKYLLLAFAKLQKKQPEVSLIIAGDGPDREKLESLAEDLELKNVSFKGYISEEQKLEYLQSSDLFSVPSLYGESFGIVLLEAMATGLVTVAGNNPGYRSVLTGLGSLSLIDPKDTDEYSHRLDLLLHENALRKLWREWAKDQIPKYSTKAIVDQYETLYEKAIKTHRRKRRLLLRK